MFDLLMLPGSLALYYTIGGAVAVTLGGVIMAIDYAVGGIGALMRKRTRP